MIVVFEDDERDIMSRFFQQAYPKTISQNFIYARGNGKIEEIVNNKLQQTTENIVVYLDTIPGNKCTQKIYTKLCGISRKSNYRVIVLPVICMEYYMVRFLQQSQVMIDHTGVNICINKDIYFSSPLIKTTDDKEFVKNFEKYCKLILKKNVKECALHGEIQNIQKKYQYYLGDCYCPYKQKDCHEEMIKEKLGEFLSQFDCVPSGVSNVGKRKIKTINLNKIWDIHRKLVNEYNAMVEYYKQNGGSNIDLSQYKTINPIKK